MTSKQAWSIFFDLMNRDVYHSKELLLHDSEAAFIEYVKCKVEEEQNADAESPPDKAAY